MIANYKISKYEQSLIIGQGEIIDFICTCPDYVFRQIHKEPKGQCKHLKEVIEKVDLEWLKDLQTVSE